MKTIFVKLATLFCATLIYLLLSSIASAQTYTYDSDGRLVSALYSNGGKINYFYDAAGNISSITTTSSIVTTMGLQFAATLNSTINRQTGLFYEQVVVSNTSAGTISGVRITATNLPAIARSNPVSLMSATGTNASGAPYIQFSTTIQPHAKATFTLAYYSKIRKAPVGVGLLVEPLNPITTAATIVRTSVSSTSGTTLSIQKLSVQAGKKPSFQFNTVTNRTYAVEYSSDLVTWKQAKTHITGTGGTINWSDAGPPDTDTPAGSGARFYRLILLNP